MYILNHLKSKGPIFYKFSSMVCAVYIGGLLVNSSFAFAEEHHAHVHGIGSLNIAQQGQEIIIEFTSPAANIVGFEHLAESQKEKEAIEKAMALLKADSEVFQLSDSAGCVLKGAELHSDQLEDNEHHTENHHDGEEEHSDHDDEHDHDSHGEESVHSEFSGEYHYQCSQPENLEEIHVGLFSVFPGIEKLAVQFFSTSKQTSFSLSAEKNVINLK